MCVYDCATHHQGRGDCAEITRIYFAILKRQYLGMPSCCGNPKAQLLGMTLPGSLSSAVSQAHSEVNVLWGGTLFSDSW